VSIGDDFILACIVVLLMATEVVELKPFHAFANNGVKLQTEAVSQDDEDESELTL
jgi:hypothetical protein